MSLTIKINIKTQHYKFKKLPHSNREQLSLGINCLNLNRNRRHGGGIDSPPRSVPSLCYLYFKVITGGLSIPTPTEVVIFNFTTFKCSL